MAQLGVRITDLNQVTSGSINPTTDSVPLVSGGSDFRATPHDIFLAAATVTTVVATGGTVGRTIADRAGDVLNVKEFGALMTGTVDDKVAFQAARSVASADSTIFVPRGGFDITVNPTGTGNVLWKLDGNKYGTGTTPVAGIGTDVVETVLGGGRFFSRRQTVADMAPVVRIDQVATHTGGTLQFVMPALQVNTTIPAGAPASPRVVT